MESWRRNPFMFQCGTTTWDEQTNFIGRIEFAYLFFINHDAYKFLCHMRLNKFRPIKFSGKNPLDIPESPYNDS